MLFSSSYFRDIMPDSLHNYSSTSFIGCATLQYHVDYFVWEKVFHRYSSRVKQVIELGTGFSGFSLFLLLHCIQRNIEFETFDHKTSHVLNRRVADAVNLADHFHEVNILDNPEEIYSFFKHPMLLYCDNGNKPKEVKLFTPHLLAGDVVAVHDWMTEIKPKDIPENYSMVFGELCDEVGSLSRFFEVI